MRGIDEVLVESYNNAHRGDEFYTKMSDIEAELENYSFTDKVVYCNCDDPSFSKFYKYFRNKFNKLGLKQLLATYYDDEPYLYVYDGKTETKTKIESGDFTKNGDIMDKCDIVVTNPPFSDNYPEQLIEMCYAHKKDFIIIGPLHLYTKVKVFKHYKNGELNIGYNNVKKFDGPDGKTSLEVPCIWLTSFNVNHPPVKLDKTYSADVYPKYDNYDAISCPHSNMIPYDYKGNIATSIQFATLLSRDQFEIIDAKSPRLDGHKVFMKLIVKLKN